ncbi:hypothetical protein Tdes44962_MAKER03271 [Teratosphaeria destructans]|uniref:Uncharacterized protein n=1 Tax=Teratosphaeria destructans TaxID=418781 RepID=A0A9W7W217_9PEZI|nr:hypothetical protein Tdes44962_MAKER03271 [Teratosphaeria destructans]
MTEHVLGRPRESRKLAEEFRQEIEERTRLGETCAQIADTFKARGIQISDKTISKRRLQWGLRQRAVRSLAGQPLKTPRKNSRPHADERGRGIRKALIEELTLKGKNAEEIAGVLLAQGFTLKKGKSSICRLQTRWGLIPYDPARARGRYPYNGKPDPKPRKQKDPNAPTEPKRSSEKAINSATDAATTSQPIVHYPGDCSFGPQKRNENHEPHPDQMHMQHSLNLGPAQQDSTDHLDLMVDPDLDDSSIDEDGLVPAQYDFNEPTHQQYGQADHPTGPQDVLHHAQSQVPAPSRATAISSRNQSRNPKMSSNAQSRSLDTVDVMSAEILVDLASSTLTAANTLKDLVLAVQMQRPAPGTFGVLPPTAEDLVNARQRLKEAASLVVDLASDSGSDRTDG